MYLHLGDQVVAHADDIIGVFDLDNTSISKSTRDFLAQAERRAEVKYVSTQLDPPKSFVVCKSEKRAGDKTHRKQKVYLLQVAAATIYKRWKTATLHFGR